ncbi:hypothetical protein IJ541_10785 [bacterium]|nr:hypothetical protein [bacterium]
MKKIIGFTMAEVLITIGIVGVISALTIPTLMFKINEKRTVTKLKTTQSILSRALKMAEEENGDIEGWNLIGHNEESAKNAANKLKPFLKLALDCSSLTQKKCYPKIDYKYLNGRDYSDLYNGLVGNYHMILLNGSAITVLISTLLEDEGLMLFVDLNGEKGPNVWGRDLFAFTYYNHNLAPAGNAKYRPYKTTCKLTNTGVGCAYYVINFGKMDYLKNK